LRIIGGTHKGRIIHAPKNLPVRPTTDRAKESLFNILGNHFDFTSLSVLDLFAGTGNISFEFASREAISVVAVDRDHGCVRFIQSVAGELDLNQLDTVKSDAFVYLRNCSDRFDIIFSDPPYQLNRSPDLARLVVERQLLLPGGWFILEHPVQLDVASLEGFFEKRVYGQSAFSFFKMD
jgi:16S rRNA (guanine(966)-N(2))-methyltransferase RsmD